MANVYDVADKLRAEALAGERRAANELVRAYGQVWRRLSLQLDPLIRDIERARAAGRVVDQSWLARESRLRTLLANTERALRGFAREADLVVRHAQAEAVEAALDHTERLVLEAGIEGSFTAMPKAAVAELVGFTADGSPLRSLLDELPRDGGRMVRQRLIEGLAEGKNPRTIERMIRQAMGGNMARGLTIARTETMRAYREATRQSYLANSDVVRGWQWSADLGPRTCVVCWSMHGTFHTNDEPFGSHPNCRCTTIPVTNRRQIRDQAAGEDVFRRQPEMVKLAVLGPSKLAAYKQGRIGLDDLVAYRNHPDWGPTRTERSLRSALRYA